MTTIQFLGGATIRCDGALVAGPAAQRHRVALLALVVTAWPHALGRDRAMALLWPEHDGDRARRLLNLAVHVLRRAIGEDVIVSAGDGLLFEPTGVACDLHAFRQAAADTAWATAADAYAGPFLDGFHLPESVEFQYWLDERRSEMARACEEALVALADEQTRAGDVRGHIGTCRRLVAADPYSGPHARALMLALDAAGDRGSALRHAQEHARRLWSELEIEPDAETTLLAQQLQAGAEPVRRDSPDGAAAHAAGNAAPHAAGNAAPPPADGAARFVHAATRDGGEPVRRPGAPEEPTLQAPGARSPVLAVMAAHDAAASAADAALGAEIRDRIIGRLLRSSAVTVAAVDSEGVRLVASGGDRPRADAVIEARARHSGEKVELRLRMIDAVRGVFLLSTQLEQPTSALDDLVDEATEAVTRVLTARAPFATAPVSEYDVEEARVLCAKGQYFCARREESALRRAITCFERALALAPTYAPAHTGLASAYAILGFYDLMAPREAFSLAKQAAQTARALNPADPNCHASLGYIAKYYDWHWSSAERELHTAIQLDPQNPLAHQWLGNYLVLRGESTAAIDSMKRAVRLAPHSAIATAATGWAHYFAGEFERAIDYCVEASELDPQLSMARAWRGQTLLELRRYDEAVAELRAAAALMPASAAFEADLAHALARSGAREEATQIVRGLGRRRRTDYVPSYEFAKAHLALGNRSKALSLLEQAWRERSHSMGILRVDRQLATLRDEPRFQHLLTLVGHG